MNRRIIWMTREQGHRLIEAWWSPDCREQKQWRHRAIDHMFDLLEQQRQEEILADPLQHYPDTWEGV